MDEDTEYLKLPLEERMVHKLWKARVSGYEEAKKLFGQVKSNLPYPCSRLRICNVLHQSSADPDPPFHFSADLDPTLHFNPVLDPTFNFDAASDPDRAPAPYQSNQWFTDPPRFHFKPSRLLCEHKPPSWLHFEPLQLLKSFVYAHPDSVFFIKMRIQIQLPKLMRIRNPALPRLAFSLFSLQHY
jgi:hypothetical protein